MVLQRRRRRRVAGKGPRRRASSVCPPRVYITRRERILASPPLDRFAPRATSRAGGGSATAAGWIPTHRRPAAPALRETDMKVAAPASRKDGEEAVGGQPRGRRGPRSGRGQPRRAGPQRAAVVASPSRSMSARCCPGVGEEQREFRTCAALSGARSRRPWYGSPGASVSIIHPWFLNLLRVAGRLARHALSAAAGATEASSRPSGVSILGIALGVAALDHHALGDERFQKEVRDQCWRNAAEIFAADGAALPTAGDRWRARSAIPMARPSSPRRRFARGGTATRRGLRRNPGRRGARHPTLRAAAARRVAAARARRLEHRRRHRNSRVPAPASATRSPSSPGRAAHAGGRGRSPANHAGRHLRHRALRVRQRARADPRRRRGAAVPRRGPSGVQLRLKDLHQAEHRRAAAGARDGSGVVVTDWTRAQPQLVRRGAVSRSG